jgi:Domain of unknown function (DUF4082)
LSKHRLQSALTTHRRQRAGWQSNLGKKWTLVVSSIAMVLGALSGLALHMSNVSAEQRPIYTIYPATTVPTTPAEDDRHAVELGVRFSAAQSGTILGVRYYKSAQNTGPHTGSVWTAGGKKLATATFSNESRSGWQTVKFATPVTVNANQTYVASYHTNAGYYAQQQWTFARQSKIGNSMVAGSAGVFQYGGSAFPVGTWHDATYYVDVLFQPSGSAPASSPPATKSPSRSKTPPPGRATRTPSPSSSSGSSSSTSSQTTSSAPPSASATPTAPAAGGQPTSGHGVGVPAGTQLTKYTGPTTITRNGTVINNAEITGMLRIQATGVVITNSLLDVPASEYTAIDMWADNASLTISDSTIRGADDGIEGDNYTAARVEVTKLGSDGFKLGNNVHITQAYCHDMSPTPSAHADCVQMQNGVVNSSVTNSWLDGGRNSALFLAPDLGPSSNGPVTISGNVLGNGNYTLYCVDGNNGQYFVKNISIINNRFLRDAQYGPDDINVPVTASNNTWYDTGKPVSGLG